MVHVTTPYPFQRVRVLMYRARHGTLSYEQEQELRTLLAREQPLCLTMPWERLIDYGMVSIGWQFWKQEHAVAT